MKTEWLGYRMVKKNYDDVLSRFHLIPERYGRTDRQTELLYQYRASVCWRAIKSLKSYILTEFSSFIKTLKKIKTRYFYNRVFQPWILQTFARAKLGRGLLGGPWPPGLPSISTAGLLSIIIQICWFVYHCWLTPHVSLLISNLLCFTFYARQ